MTAYASLCDGIGATHVAWSVLGWRCLWTSEIDPFAVAVVEARWPGLVNLGDMTRITQEAIDDRGRPDIVAGGTPCQSFSYAGGRAGLDDPRGNLALRFVQLVGACRPRWVVWENVPGVLSSRGGRDLGAILGALAELGYGFAWRVLDARHFGVPQRRRDAHGMVELLGGQGWICGKITQRSRRRGPSRAVKSTTSEAR